MKKFILGAAVAAATLVGALSAQAASLSIIGGNTVSLNSDFSLAGTTGLAIGTEVLAFNSSNDGPNTGLYLTGSPVDVTFEYLGSEAANYNRSFEYDNGGTNFLFSNSGNWSVGDKEVVGFAEEGIMEFYFKTINNRYANNAGNIAAGLTLAFFQESAGSVIALFGDGAGDSDYDDLALRISVTAVPLPPAILLFGGAMIGLGWLSRRRKLDPQAV